MSTKCTLKEHFAETLKYDAELLTLSLCDNAEGCLSNGRCTLLITCCYYFIIYIILLLLLLVLNVQYICQCSCFSSVKRSGPTEHDISVHHRVALIVRSFFMFYPSSKISFTTEIEIMICLFQKLENYSHSH